MSMEGTEKRYTFRQITDELHKELGSKSDIENFYQDRNKDFNKILDGLQIDSILMKNDDNQYSFDIYQAEIVKAYFTTDSSKNSLISKLKNGKLDEITIEERSSFLEHTIERLKKIKVDDDFNDDSYITNIENIYSETIVAKENIDTIMSAIKRSLDSSLNQVLKPQEALGLIPMFFPDEYFDSFHNGNYYDDRVSEIDSILEEYPHVSRKRKEILSEVRDIDFLDSLDDAALHDIIDSRDDQELIFDKEEFSQKYESLSQRIVTLVGEAIRDWEFEMKCYPFIKEYLAYKLKVRPEDISFKKIAHFYEIHR